MTVLVYLADGRIMRHDGVRDISKPWEYSPIILSESREPDKEYDDVVKLEVIP